MLKSLVEFKLPTNFIVLEDKEDLNCQNLFVSFLKNCQYDTSVNKIYLICYDNPPEFYIRSSKCTDGKIESYNYFSLPLEWTDHSHLKTDLSFFLSDPETLAQTVFFFDSLSTLAYYHGFYSMYRNLSALKKHSKRIICVVHGDLFGSDQLEELYFIATTYIKVTGLSREKTFDETICEVTYQKAGGKIIKQKELFNVSDKFEVVSRIQKNEVPVSKSTKTNIETLTTFKLGLHMSEEEKRAKEDLILPYIKTNSENRGEELTRQSLVEEIEDDLDDDLDI